MTLDEKQFTKPFLRRPCQDISPKTTVVSLMVTLWKKLVSYGHSDCLDKQSICSVATVWTIAVDHQTQHSMAKKQEITKIQKLDLKVM